MVLTENPAANLATFVHPLEIESYLTAAFLFCLGSLIDLSVYVWLPLGLLFVYAATLVQAIGWLYLFLGTADSKVALGIFLASALAGVVSLGVMVASASAQVNPITVFWWVVLWAVPIGTLLPLVFGPVVVLHGILFAHAAETALRGVSPSGRTLVLLGVVILEVIAISAIAISAFAAGTEQMSSPVPAYPWAAGISIGYLIVFVGFNVGKRPAGERTHPVVDASN